MDGHGLALELPQICPTKSGRILGHSQSCASVVFKRLRGTALDYEDMRWTRVGVARPIQRVPLLKSLTCALDAYKILYMVEW